MFHSLFLVDSSLKALSFLPTPLVSWKVNVTENEACLALTWTVNGGGISIVTL